MNSLKILQRFLQGDRKNLSHCVRKLHVHENLKQREQQRYYLNNKEVASSLWFTSLPSRKRRALTLMDKKKAKMKRGPMPSGPLVIECKNRKLDHYRGMHYGKFDVVPLASKGWTNKNSCGDHFTILPISEHPAFLLRQSDHFPTTFPEIGIMDDLIKALNSMGITYPTTIQGKSMKSVLKGLNVMMMAETGCGKTVAYMVPMIQNILRWKSFIPSSNNSPFGVIVLPSRELTLQVGRVSQKLCQEVGLKSLILLGGQGKELASHNQVQEPVDLLVATLGVISTFVNHKIFSLDKCKTLVLDEADTLLDNSFRSHLKYFIREAKLRFMGNVLDRPYISQLCLVSATIPRNINQTLQGIISPESMEKITTNYLHKVQPHVTQKFWRVSQNEKPQTLLKIVKGNVARKVPTMIFSNKTETCNWVSLFLNENGVKSIRINGDMMANERLKEFQDFREGHVDVISCTDIASRGLDTTRVKHVINYEFPRFMADYVHRCGRTGRIGHTDDCFITNLVSKKGEVGLVNSVEKAARTEQELHNVNNNISKILKHRFLKNQEDDDES